MSNRLRALLPAFAAIFLVWTWQALTVRYSYGGNWTGLFCTGAVFPYPPALAKENIYTFPNMSVMTGRPIITWPTIRGSSVDFQITWTPRECARVVSCYRRWHGP
jgi:hypothetical protein